MNIVTEENYKRMEELNLLLKEANINKKFAIKIIDDGINIGVRVTIPSIVNQENESMQIILQESKQSSMTLKQTIDNINIDIEDLFTVIKPDVLFILGREKKKNKDEFKIIINIKKQ